MMVQITSRRFSIGGEIPNNDNYAMIAVIGFHHEGHKEPRRLSWEGFHAETQNLIFNSLAKTEQPP